MRPPSTSLRSARGVPTLMDGGWLREAERNLVAHRWELKNRSALRKCMMLPVPEAWRDLARERLEAPLAPLPQPPPKEPAPVVVHRGDPRRYARELPAYPLRDPMPAGRRAARGEGSEGGEGTGMKPRSSGPWWEDPVALGSLLVLFPPMGLAVVWSSRRYSSDARWALTIMTALTMTLVSAVLIAGLVRH